MTHDTPPLHLSAINSVLALSLLCLTVCLPVSISIALADDDNSSVASNDEVADFAEDDFSGGDFSEEQISDPLETVNRGIFWFNEQVDYLVLEPVARGYDYITPDSVQRCVGNFFDNLSTPVYLISDLTQLKFGQFADHTGRFVVNTTFGVAGLFDVAAEYGNLPRHHEDFGTALGYYEIPAGPYLVLPFLGPSNVRDGFGRIIDSIAQPVTWALPMTNASDDVVFYSNIGLRALDAIDTRAGLLEAFDAGREGSIDFYSFLRSTYFQRRHALIYDLDQDRSADDNAEDEWLEDGE